MSQHLSNEPIRPKVPPWVISIALHSVLMVVLALTFRAIPKRGAAEESSRMTGIVLKHYTPQGEYYETQEDSVEVISVSAGGSHLGAVPLDDVPVVSGIGPPPPDFAGSTVLGPGELGSSLKMTQGTVEPQRRTGGKIRTSVYGLEGEGHKFVYVFDRSESMVGTPLEAAKAELIESLGHLDKVHQFQIIFYNHVPSFFNPKRLSFGNPANKKEAQRFVAGMTAAGGTKHFPALIQAIHLHPDVIFLLTDGRRGDNPTGSELMWIRNRNKGAQIHVIQFVEGEVSTRGNSLVALAKQNGGKHIYVNTLNLKPKR